MVAEVGPEDLRVEEREGAALAEHLHAPGEGAFRTSDGSQRKAVLACSHWLMWYSTGPKLAQRAARHAWVGTGDEALPESYARAGDERYPLDVQDFLKLLRRKFGTLVRAWRVALDKDNGSELEFCEFVAAVRHMGAGHNARSLWFNLDVDQSGRWVAVPFSF